MGLFDEQTPEERSQTKVKSKREEARFSLHTKFIIDSIQRVAVSEKLNEVPDVRFSIMWEMFTIGMRETTTKALIVSLSLIALYIIKAFLFVLTGYKMSTLMILMIYGAILLIFTFFVFLRIDFLSRFAKPYVIGPYSQKLWNIFMAGNLMGYPFLMFSLGIVIDFFYFGIARIFQNKPMEFTKSISQIYNSLHTVAEKDRMYLLALQMKNNIEHPLRFFIFLSLVYTGSAIVSALLIYFPSLKLKFTKVDISKESAEMLPQDFNNGNQT